MSREKQIEEMEMTPLDILANDINQHCPDLAENYCGDTHCVACLANALYNAGYRKQSEGEWIVEEHPLVHDKKISCSCCGYSERRGPAWNISWGFHSFCPNCGAKMKGGAE